MSEEVPLEVDGVIKCPETGCDGFLDTLAPIPYTHMCVQCYAKYTLCLVDNYDVDEEEPSEDQEEEEKVEESLWTVTISIGQANRVLLVIAVILMVIT